MSGAISFNPMATTGANNSFLVDTNGFVQGTFYDDPAMRYQLGGGFVAAAQAHVIWGGLPLTLGVSQSPANAMGPSCSLATTNANIDAWCVFNQAAAMVIVPGSSVPTAGAGMSINFVRAGSLLRIALPVLGSLMSTLASGASNQQVSWDFVNNQITTYSSGAGALPIQIEQLNSSSKIVSYNSSTGAVTWNDAGPCAIVRV